jgi:hypothetical protein
MRGTGTGGTGLMTRTSGQVQRGGKGRTGLRVGVGPQSEGKAANKCSPYVGTPSRLLDKHSR